MKTNAKSIKNADVINQRVNGSKKCIPNVEGGSNRTSYHSANDDQVIELAKIANSNGGGNFQSLANKQIDIDTVQTETINNTGMPEKLKSGIETLSGFSMDDVKVHYNSDKPGKMQAHAFAQGTDIHLASGQEKHLPHEAWHVVQQKQGRVKPTIQLKGKININDDVGLETEADMMGVKSTRIDKLSTANNSFLSQHSSPPSNTIQMHPLEFDDATYNIEVLEALQKVQENATLKDLILLETPEAVSVMKDYIKKKGKTGKADAILLRSILATIELHTSGVWHEAVIKNNDSVLGDNEKKILSIMQSAYIDENKKMIAATYRLSKQELHSIECYTQPGKNKQEGPWFMGPDKKWTEYKDGWKTLEAALAKLPSLQDLGLEITTYRAIRTDDTTRKNATGSGLDPTTANLSNLPPETNILHGANPIPPFGQKHYTSTGITYTSSHMTKDRTGQGLVAMTGRSGKYIGPLGVAHWSHDAGEVLYPPEMYSKFEGTAPHGWQDKEGTLPVHHLREIDHPEPYQGIVEDHNFETRRHRDPNLDKTKMILISKIEKMVEKDPENISMARARANVQGPIMYLSFYELKRLIDYLGLEDEVQSSEARKMTLIQEIEKSYTQKGAETFAKARLQSEVHGDMMYLSMDELIRLKTALTKI